MKRKVLPLIALLLAATVFCASASADLYDQDEVQQMAVDAWKQAVDAAYQDETRRDEASPEHQTIETTYGPYEADVYSISDGTNTMQYLMQVIGEPDEYGMYPLYICLHGGGTDAENGQFNNFEWVDMFDYYKGSVTSGIYVAVRGINNNWNLHFDDASYPLYDRLIEDMIVFCQADPNRVYLLGFSAGGDGVYAIAPRMADRLAAADESSGHPNGVSLLNVANLPICIQAGIRDIMFEPLRSVVAASFDQYLDECRTTCGFGYEHKVYIHVPEGHNYSDYDPEVGSTQEVLTNPQAFVDAMNDEEFADQFDVNDAYALPDDEETNSRYRTVIAEAGLETTQADTNAVRFVSQYTREANPANVVWDLTTRATSRETTSFYWLDADKEVTEGLIVVCFDAETNTFDVDIVEAPNGSFSILLRPSMVDFSQPVYVVYGDQKIEVDVELDEDLIASTAADTLDPEMVSAASIDFASLAWAD